MLPRCSIRLIFWRYLPPVLGIRTDSTSPTGVIKGKVRDPLGAAIPNAVIRLFDEGAHNAEGMTKAERNGTFQLSAADGFYDILVSAAGFSPQCARIRVHGGKTAVHNVRLQVDQLTLKERGDSFGRPKKR